MSISMELLVLATEAGAEEDSIQLLPDLPELIWGFVGFALLMAFMAKYVFPRMNDMLEQRQTRIQGEIEQAAAERQQAEELRRQYERQLNDARGEGSRIIDEARGQGDRMRADIVAKAEQEAGQIVARAREDVEAERGRMMGDLRTQVAVLSVELAGKIVQKELDPSQHRVLVDSYINELSGLN